MDPQDIKKSRPLWIICALVGGIAGYTAVHSFVHRAANVDSVLIKTCGEINKTLPMIVDKETRLDTTTTAPNKTIIYHYTLVNLNAAEVHKDEIFSVLRPKVVTNYKTNASMKPFRDLGVTMQYQYSDKNGNPVTEFDVGPKD